ncbi:hypothetical protein EV12_2129 [Prochlorococcus sp. MIT 0701]|nr:hypothetical protein EV12_2129 [Prochlorococcus sp. MIT 0701]
MLAADDVIHTLQSNSLSNHCLVFDGVFLFNSLSKKPDKNLGSRYLAQSSCVIYALMRHCRPKALYPR